MSKKKKKEITFSKLMRKLAKRAVSANLRIPKIHVNIDLQKNSKIEIRLGKKIEELFKNNQNFLYLF